MPGIFKVKDLEERKRQIVAQSDIYREMTRRDVDNLRLSALAVKKKLAWVQRSSSLLPVAAGLMGFFAWRRHRHAAKTSPPRSVASLIGRELLRNLLPIGGSFLAKRLLTRRNSH